MVSLDVITMGRISVDVYPLQIGVSLREVESFGKYLGGSSTNVAVAAARYGHRVATITRTGADPFGEFLHDALRGFGVDDRYVTPVPGLPTPVAFCEIFPPDDFPLYFYRFPKAPDLEIREDELDFDAIRAAQRVLGHGHRALAGAEPQRHARRARGARQVRHHRARPRLPPDVLGVARGPPASGSAARSSTSPSRSATSTRPTPPSASASRAPPRGPCASAGSSWRSSSRGRRACSPTTARRAVEVPPVPVEVVNGLGAGDAFGGALCHGLLAGWDLERMMRFCNAAGALVASRLACADAMPEEHEVEELLAHA